MTDAEVTRERYEVARTIIVPPVALQESPFTKKFSVVDVAGNKLASCKSQAVAETLVWAINRGMQRLHPHERQTLDELLAGFEYDARN